MSNHPRVEAFSVFPRENWRRGPWDDEPDHLEWITEAGYPGIIKRNVMGVLNGYVGLPEGHPAFELDYHAMSFDFIEVHGGITFSGEFSFRPDGPNGLWWIGFDTGHHDDLSPAMFTKEFTDDDLNSMGMTYKDLVWVRREVERLARQLKELE